VGGGSSCEQGGVGVVWWGELGANPRKGEGKQNCILTKDLKSGCPNLLEGGLRDWDRGRGRGKEKLGKRCTKQGG